MQTVQPPHYLAEPSDYILLEGNLAEIDEYTYEDPDNIYDGAGNWMFMFKDDHPTEFESCGFCSMTRVETDAHFKFLHQMYDHISRRVNAPIWIDGKEI